MIFLSHYGNSFQFFLFGPGSFLVFLREIFIKLNDNIGNNIREKSLHYPLSSPFPPPLQPPFVPSVVKVT